MKNKLLIVFYFLSASSFAQSGWFVRPNFSYNKVSMLNSENALNTVLIEQPSFNQIFGLDLGFQFTDEKSGLYAISAGVLSNPITLNYKGTYDQVGAPFWDSESTLKLNYITIPINFEFALLKQKKITPIASIGVHVSRLTSYYDDIKVIDKKRPEYNETYIIENGSYTEKYNKFTLNATLNQWYYTKWLFGIHSALGAKIKINKRWNATMRIQGSFNINDTENKAVITHTTNGYGKLVYNPYEYYYAKIARRYPYMGERGISRNLIVGVQVGISYLFIKGYRVSIL